MMAENGIKKYLISTAATITAALVLQSGVLLWWGGAMSARMTNAEQNIERVDARVIHLEHRK